MFDLSGKPVKKEEYAGKAALCLKSGPALYAGTAGLDGRPQVRPAAFAFEQGGALYFLTLKSCRMYAELSKTPYVQFCMIDAESQLTFRLSGKVCFTEDVDLIERAAASCPQMLKKAGNDRKMLIAFFLLGAEMILETENDEKQYRLPDPGGVLIGITVKKKTELRDRIARILERRESEPPALDAEALRLYDGALFVFAEAAKALWPRMDIRPLERSAAFETYDEREKYTARAASIIGNAVIDKPEDLTYLLNPEKWAGEFLRTVNRESRESEDRQ